MDPNTDTAHDDLAFLKALVSEGGQAQASLGLLLFCAGVLYGTHASLLWFGQLGWVELPQGMTAILISAAPTIIFLGLLGWVIWHDRKLSHYGVASRALNAAFGGAGVASLTTSIVFGYIAVQRGDIFFWLFHPIMSFVIQGTVWYVAFAIRRRAWLGVVAVCWHLSALAMAILLQRGQFGALLGVLSLGLLLLMAVPGWIMWRSRG